MIIGNLNNIGGRFGNKLLYYNNVAQVSNYFNVDYYCNKFNNDHIFEFSNKNIETLPEYSNSISSKFLIENKNIKNKEINVLLEPCLGELFFEYTNKSTNEIFKFKKEYIKNFDTNIISVHFRGGDFHTWEPQSILPVEYYLEAIQESIKLYDKYEIYLFTDDLNLNSYISVIDYFKKNNLKYNIGNLNDMISDFLLISYSDVVISSPSTFCVTASFCGKENKKIIHSKKWIKYRILNGDKFWIDLNNGGNKYYKLFKLI